VAAALTWKREAVAGSGRENPCLFEELSSDSRWE
jgi:hypothetical protein